MVKTPQVIEIFNEGLLNPTLESTIFESNQSVEQDKISLDLAEKLLEKNRINVEDESLYSVTTDEDLIQSSIYKNLSEQKRDQLESGSFVSASEYYDPTTGTLSGSEIGVDVNVYADLSGIAYAAGDDPNAAYDYQVSLLSGNVSAVVLPGVITHIEVGAGGTATVVGGTHSVVYLWHQKDLIWENDGLHNTLDLGPEIGTSRLRKNPCPNRFRFDSVVADDGG